MTPPHISQEQQVPRSRPYSKGRVTKGKDQQAGSLGTILESAGGSFGRGRGKFPSGKVSDEKGKLCAKVQSRGACLACLGKGRWCGGTTAWENGGGDRR